MDTKKSLLASWYLSRISDTDMFFDDEVEDEGAWFCVELEGGAVEEDDDKDEDWSGWW